MIADPVYVAGLERTGTSLMYALLASHPAIAMTRRTNLWTYFFGQFGDLAEDANLDACLDLMRRYKRLVVLDIDWDRVRTDFRSGGDHSYAALFDAIESQVAGRLGKPRWGDKSLHTERYAEAIIEAFPSARILHMIRDPRDRFASVMARWKVRRGGAGASVAEWLESARLAEANCARWSSNCMIVRYEDLASDPVGAMQAVCDFLGEPYAPEMLEMEGAAEFRDAGANSSYGPRKVGVISPASVGKYREVLSPAEISFIQAKLGDEMLTLGYGLDPLESFRRGFGDMLGAAADAARFHLWRAREERKNKVGRRLPAYRIVEPR